MTLSVRSGSGPLVALAVALMPLNLAGQQMRTDSLTLADLRSRAADQDPRASQLSMLRRQSTLRVQNIGTARRPQISMLGLAQYLSDVPRIPVQSPGMRPPPNDNYDAHIAARQLIFDATLSASEEVQRTQLAESEARVRTTLFGVKQEVNESFFDALLLGARRSEVTAAIQTLQAQLANARERVANGAALRSEALAIEAELARRKQTIVELDAARAAALTVLADLTGQDVDSAVVLALPELAAQVAAHRSTFQNLRARPEYEQFARNREVLAARQSVLGAQDRPKVFAFSRAGYGRPGLNPLARDFDEYWLAGLQVEWSPMKWGSTDRERQALAVQQEIIDTELAALDARIRRGAAVDLATIDRLQSVLESDDEIIALREQILAESRVRHREGVITSAEFVDRETDLLAARIARATHRVELARASARFLTLIGQEVR